MTEVNEDAVAASVNREPYVAMAAPPKAVPGKLKREPARVVSVVGAVIALGMAFGLELDEQQVGAIVSVVMLLIGEITRGKVKPADTED